MAVRAFITGVSGPVLTDGERAFLRAEQPWGFILFKRNVENPAQVTALVAELRAEKAELERIVANQAEAITESRRLLTACEAHNEMLLARLKLTQGAENS